MLVVYVGDFKMPGPRDNHAGAWMHIMTKIAISVPQGPGLYLGCNQIIGEVQFADGTKAKTMTYDMSGFFVQCVDEYLKLTGLQKSSLRKVSTPFIQEDQKQSPARCVVRPGEPWFECEWCKRSFPASLAELFGSPAATAEWIIMQPLLATLLGVDPSGRDGSAADAFEQR